LDEETKFPEWRRFECGDHVSWTWTISKLEMDDWFRRCLADFPNIKAIVESDPLPNMSRTFQALLCIGIWKTKWFSQFMEEVEE